MLPVYGERVDVDRVLSGRSTGGRLREPNERRVERAGESGRGGSIVVSQLGQSSQEYGK